MKKQITLTNDTIYTLRNLINDIDYNESLDEECNTDQVLEDLYKVIDILRPILEV